MTKYIVSKKATKDIELIWFYTKEKWSLEQANRYYNLILDNMEYIAAFPLSGIDYSHIRKDYRCSKIKSHLIFYKYKKKENCVEIIRVLHHSLDIERRLKE